MVTEVGITLIGRVRGKRMKVYIHDWRVNEARGEKVQTRTDNQEAVVVHSAAG